MMRILVFHTWGIGDWLFFTPVIRGLLSAWKECEIIVAATNPGVRELVKLYPNTIAEFAPFGTMWPYMTVASAVARTWFSRVDCIVFTAGMSTLKAGAVAKFARSKRKLCIATDTPPLHFTEWAEYNVGVHRVENNLQFLKLLGVNRPDDASPWIPSQTMPKSESNRILIHPGSSKKFSFKRWGSQQFAELAVHFAHSGYRVSILIGPDETDLTSAFCNLGSADIDIVTPSSLLDLIRTIHACQLVVNSDSAVGHFAAALGKKTVTVFGPGDPRLVRPYSAHALTVRAKALLPCMPCMVPGGKYGCEERGCLASLSVEEVKAAVNQCLSGQITDVSKC